MQVIVREATENDLASMYVVSIEAHRRAYDTLIPRDNLQRFIDCYTPSTKGRARYSAKMAKRVNDERWQLWVAARGDSVVGYTLREWKDKRNVQLRGLFVHPDYFSRGIGRRLFETSLESIGKKTKITFTVLKHNERAKKLYLQYGFKVVGSGEDFFGAPQDIMEKWIH